jgi:stage III sporulation protein SpoIIIAA
MEQLHALLARDAALRGEAETVVAVDCEGVPEELFLIQVATSARVLVLDCVLLGVREACQALAPLLTSEITTKLLHDLHNDAAAMASLGGIELAGCLDSQLAMEALHGKLHMGFNDMLQQVGQDRHPSKFVMKLKMGGAHAGGSGSIFAQRPLPRDIIEYAAWDACLLLAAHTRLVELLGDQLPKVMQASDARASHAAKSGGRRRVCVDLSNQYALASRELIEACRPDDMQPAMPLVVSNDVDPLLSLLPADLVVGLDGLTLQLSDIVLDKGRRPQAWCSGKRIFLGQEDRKVAADDLDDIVSRIGGFGSDNRAGLHEQLHRISAIRNRADLIIGLTMRVGRHVSGNAAMIADLLFHDDASILFLGEPGSGKTTVVREVTRLLAERSNVLIVDTSNEIAGDGDVPHPCVGHARRMQVRSLEEQGDVMIEGVQNHTPEVMVIDEIGRPPEVEAARTVKQRGVRIIASAHGDLRKLLKNKQLRGLIGGVELVTLGDAQAKEEARRRGLHPSASIDKIRAQRAGPPVFDIIVELRRGEPNEWRIVNPCAKAVDMILEGSHYLSQRRTRDPVTGEFFLELEKA